jgi:hypothetical protein
MKLLHKFFMLGPYEGLAGPSRGKHNWPVQVAGGHQTGRDLSFRANHRPHGVRRAKPACCRGASPCRKGSSESILTSSFDAECMLARAKSVHGFGRSSKAITNTTWFPETSVSCAPSEDASTGCGEAFWPAAVNALGRNGSNSSQSSKDGS